MGTMDVRMGEGFFFFFFGGGDAFARLTVTRRCRDVYRSKNASKNAAFTLLRAGTPYGPGSLRGRAVDCKEQGQYEEVADRVLSSTAAARERRDVMGLRVAM
jgi:hypothetical protein